MKSETLQNIFMYLLAGLCAYFLNKANGCQRPAVTTSYVMKCDTVRQYVQVEGPTVYTTRVRIERDTVYDTLIIEPNEEGRVSHEATHPMQPMPGADSLLIYEGEQAGAEGKCAFKYTIAMANDSLQFVNIEAECKTEVKYVTVEVPAQPALSQPAPYAARPWRWGPKVAWSPQDGHTMYGGQAMWRTIYASANYAPAAQGWILEAGFMWPIGKKKTPTAALYGFGR